MAILATMLRIGFGQADITPAVAGQIGAVNRRAMTGVHDPLLAVACVIDDGKTPVALVGIDAGVIMRNTATAARTMIASETGIPAANVIISASHTHQGGPTLSTFNAVAEPDYAKLTARGVADAVASAWTNRQPASFGSGFGHVSEIHFNRRFLMRDGREVTHPGRMNPDIVRPAGPVDDKVGVLAIRDANQKLAGLVVNFGCHCTVTEDGDQYSADYVHYIRKHVAGTLGAVPVAFLLGACGDITQIDNQSTRVEKGHEWADHMGATLAESIVQAVRRIAWRDDASIRVATKSTPIAVRAGDECPPPTMGLGSGENWEQIYEREKPHVAEMRRTTPQVDCEVTAMRIGDLGIVCNGAELFCQPALDTQQASRWQTWVVTLANEYIGYVPTASAHVAGGYEVCLARSSYLALDAAQKLVEASLKALQEVKHDE